MTSRVDLHCHSTASQLSRLGVQRSLGLPECATPPRGGLRAGQAAGDGLRHDHRPRHDRRVPRAGRPSRLLRLRGADRPLRRRAPGGSRPLLRDHSRRPRVAAGTCRRRRGLRRIPARERDRLRARAPLLQRRGAADPAPPPPPGGALPDLGGPQRVAGRRAEHARRRLHRDPRRHRHRRLRRPCRRRHRPHLHRGARAPRRRKSFSPTSAPAAPRRGANRAAPPSGRTRRWRWRRGRSALDAGCTAPGDGARARPGRGAEDGRAGDPRGRRPRGRGRRRHRPRRRPRAARGLARRDRPRAARRAADRLPAGRRASPTPTSTAAPAASTTAACAAAIVAGHRGASPRGDIRAAVERPLRGAAAGGPLRAGDRLPRRREGEAGRAGTERARRGSP